MTWIKVPSVIPFPPPPLPPPPKPYLLFLVVNFWKLAFSEFRCHLSRQWIVCQKSQVK